MFLHFSYSVPILKDIIGIYSLFRILALIDLDNDSEDLVKTLINKVDAIIDPKVVDSKNVSMLFPSTLNPRFTIKHN